MEPVQPCSLATLLLKKSSPPEASPKKLKSPVPASPAGQLGERPWWAAYGGRTPGEGCETPLHHMAMPKGQRQLMALGFRTPQRVSPDDREKKAMLQFLTPQHHSSSGRGGRWVGSSPINPANVPKESMDRRMYLRLQSPVATDWEGFSCGGDKGSYEASLAAEVGHGRGAKRGRRGKWLLGLFGRARKSEAATLGSEKKGEKGMRRIFRTRDYRNRWPQGWC